MSLTSNMLFDLREKFEAVRDQGPRPLCLVFASSDLNSFSNQIIEDLSVEYLAHHAYKIEKNMDYSTGLMVSSVIKAIAQHGQPHEKEMPYDPSLLVPLCPIDNLDPLFFSAFSETCNIVSSINQELENGNATVVIMSLPNSIFTLAEPFELDIENGNVGNHAVVIVGKAVKPDGKVFYMIRNSWGVAWADNGYCWVSEGFLKSRAFALITMRSK